VVDFFKSYIDDVSEMGELGKKPILNTPFMYSSDGGLGFCSNETEYFKTILDYLKNKSEIAAEADIEQQVESILCKAEFGNFEELHKLIYKDNYKLSSQPVLMNVDPDRLASFMTRDAPELNAGARLLAYRYHNIQEKDPLIKEITWARSVYSSVVKKLEQWEQPHQAMGLRTLNSTLLYHEETREAEHRIVPTIEDDLKEEPLPI